MRLPLVLVVLLLVLTTALAQIDDETAKARALEYAARIGYTSEGQDVIVFRESNPPAI
jgi:hypothetical protein